LGFGIWDLGFGIWDLGLFLNFNFHLNFNFLKELGIVMSDLGLGKIISS